MITQDEIIKMAREAGFVPAVAWQECTPPFERFAALVAAAEREACAKACEEGLPYGMSQTIGPAICAAAIRARSEK